MGGWALRLASRPAVDPEPALGPEPALRLGCVARGSTVAGLGPGFGMRGGPVKTVGFDAEGGADSARVGGAGTERLGGATAGRAGGGGGACAGREAGGSGGLAKGSSSAPIGS
jgi:hypothetical protein